jgi:glycolate oxidase FAD binding subunit
VTALRIEGPAPSTMFRMEKLADLLRGHGRTHVTDDRDSHTLWREVRDVLFFSGDRARAVWRISVAPSRGHAVALDLARQLDVEHFYDWGGGQLWFAVNPTGADGGAATLRTAIAAHGGGHATLVRAPEALRASVAVFEPLEEPLAALTSRIKESFDPRRILNPGRMYAGV